MSKPRTASARAGAVSGCHARRIGGTRVQTIQFVAVVVVKHDQFVRQIITASGDWTNASPIGVSYTVASLSSSTPGNSSHERIVQGDVVAVPFTVKAGAAELTAHLEWAGDWGAYPTNDPFPDENAGESCENATETPPQAKTPPAAPAASTL